MDSKTQVRSPFKFLFALTFLVGAAFQMGCNKDFNSTLKETDINDTIGIGDGTKKVLFIVMEGVKGQVVESIAPTNISQIVKNSIYTYDGLVDSKTYELTGATAWTNLLTGVDYSKHHVETSDYTGFDNSQTPSLFTRIKAEKEKSRTVALSSDGELLNNLAIDATESTVLANDDAVKAATIKELQEENPSLIMAHFSAANVAANGDYSENNVAYTAAIQSLDQTIGDLVKALKSRRTYNSENWMVVIASNMGGGESGGEAGANAYEDPSRNTFVVFYCPKFKTDKRSMPNLDALPFTGSSPRYISNNGNTNGIANQTNTNIGNFGTSGAYTLMFKFRDDNSSLQYYPMFFGKRNPANTDVGAKGWSFLMGGTGMQLDWGGSPRPSTAINPKDGKWHTLGFTIYPSGSIRKLNLFSDGVMRQTVDITNNNADNEFPLRLGTDKRFNTNLIYRDIVILNVALSDAEMIKYMRKEFDRNNPYYNNMIGFWPSTEYSNTELLDLSGYGNNFKFSTTIDFTSYSDISDNISPNISASAYTVVPNSVDVSVMIYNWMNINIPSSWGLMGQYFTPIFNLSTD